MSSGKDKVRIGIVLLVVSLIGLLIFASFFFTWGHPMWTVGSYMGTIQDLLTMKNATKLAADYLSTLNNKDLAIDEIMEFEFNFYIVYFEKTTGMGAFEAIIDKVSTSGMTRMMSYSYVRPEQGPNMIWNTKYGMHRMMSGGNINNASITATQAREYAEKYLDAHFPGAIAEDVHPFYGYYTIHMMKDGKISGMLSVNGFTGQVWYHNWHGNYIQSLESLGP
jgi:hypothetical protein